MLLEADHVVRGRAALVCCITLSCLRPIMLLEAEQHSYVVKLLFSC